MIKGCLVIHGLTATPATVSSLTTSLISNGFRVAAPCLAGHGSSLDALAKSSWQDWYTTVREAYLNLRSSVDSVYCVGISLGSLLSIKLAIDEGFGIRALSLLSTPIILPMKDRILIPILRYSPLRWLISSIGKDLEMSVGDPEGARLYAKFSQPRIPPSAIFSLCDLQNEVRSNLSKLLSPISILHGAADGVAPIQNVAEIERLTSSEVVESHIFKNSRHVISMDREKDDVARIVADFFARY